MPALVLRGDTLKVEINKVTPLYPRAVFVQWKVTPDNAVTGTYSFSVERSGSPEGPWTQVATLQDSVSVTDSFETPDKTSDETNLLSLQRSIYYRVTATDPRNTVAVSLPVDLDGLIAGDTKQQDRAPDPHRRRQILLRRKILRDETVAFRALNGIQLKVLKRKHFGTRCTVCYDKLTRATVRSQCPICYGTSWVGGYFAPISTLGRLAPSPTQTSLTSEGKSDINTTQLTLLNYPKVERDDVIAELNGNTRWLVQQVAPTELKRVVVHQRVFVVELPRGSPEYNLPIF